MAENVGTDQLPASAALPVEAAELARIVRQQQAVLRLQREIIDSLAHEVRTPIAAIQNACYLIENFGAGSDQQRVKWQGMIKDAADLLRQLLTDIVEVKELEASAKSVTREAASAAALVQAEIARHGAAAGRVQLAVASGSEADRLIDPRAFSSAVAPLIANALLYSEAPSPVTVRVEVAEETLSVTVSDLGRGIPAGETAALFTVFSRASNVGAVPGSGLGLVVARCAAELHGGTITCTSRENEGSTFVLSVHAPPLAGAGAGPG